MPQGFPGSATHLDVSRCSVALLGEQRDMTIAARLKEAREALGLSQPDAALKFATPVGTIRNYEQGVTEPKALTLAAMVRLGINANWLLTGEGDMLLEDAQRAAAEVSWQGIPASLQYPALMEPTRADAAPVVDIGLLTRCVAACALAYGPDFPGLDVDDQVAYAGDLYNRLVRMAGSSHTAGAQAALLRLDVPEIADQLRLFIKMGMAKQFHPRQVAPKADAA